MKVMGNFNMLVLHVIMWRRSWHCKDGTWCTRCTKRDQNSEYLAPYTRICSRMKRNFMAFLDWIWSNSIVCHNWWERKYEINTNYIGRRFHVKGDLYYYYYYYYFFFFIFYFFWYLLY